MASNYPPGVTGSEPEIAGYPPCGRNGCGHLDEEHAEPAIVNGLAVGPSPCEVCECEDYQQWSEGPDW